MELSVVIPVYGCADCLVALHERLAASLESITPDYEIVFVDDRSPDASWDVLARIAAADPHVVLVRLSRNFGQSVAVTAGIAESQGRYVVLMDCDLQDRPEDIERLYAKAMDGFDTVFSRRAVREQSWFRRAAASAYFRLRNALLQIDMDPGHGSLMLISRRVADAFLAVGDRDRHHALMLHWLGFESTMVDVPHAARHAGKSSYTLRKLLSSAASGMFFQTTVLLRWIVYLGFAVSALGMAFAAFLVVFYFLVDPYPGWTSLAVLTLVVGGFIIASIGVAALYVGKIFEQVKGRPLYIVDRRVTHRLHDRDSEVAGELRSAR